MISAGKKIHTLVTNVPEALPPLRERKTVYLQSRKQNRSYNS